MPIQRALYLEYLIFALFCFELLPRHVSATLVNITVDDSAIDTGATRISYAPQLEWNIGNNCSACTARPNPQQAFAGTWHDSTFPQGGGEADLKTASLEFNGSAIYVYCILARSFTSPDGNSDMTFFLDGQDVGKFSLSPSGDSNYDYNVPVYSNNSIPPGAHSFTLQNGQIGGAKSLILLDFFVYSQDNGVSVGSGPSAISTEAAPTQTPGSTKPPTSSASSDSSSVTAESTTAVSSNQTHSDSSKRGEPSPHTRTIIIAATVAGSVVVLGSLAALIFFCRKRPQHPYQYEPPSEPRIVENPSSSGWAEDAWGPGSGGVILEHPSLAPVGGVAGDLRGDLSTRDRGRGRREESTKKQGRGLTESSSATVTGSIKSTSQWSQPQRPSAATSSTAAAASGPAVAIEMSKLRTHRHPYAARTPEPDVDSFSADGPIREGDERELGSAATHIATSTPSGSGSQRAPKAVPIPSSADSPERPRAQLRPLPMRPMLESQAYAARLRRQNSTTTTPISDMASGEDSPPSYDASRHPRDRI